jgi:hypothetical protein
MTARSLTFAIDLFELCTRLPVLAVISHLASAFPVVISRF